MSIGIVVLNPLLSTTAARYVLNVPLNVNRFGVLGCRKEENKERLSEHLMLWGDLWGVPAGMECYGVTDLIIKTKYSPVMLYNTQ